MNLKSQLQGLATRTAILQEYTQAVAQQYRITPAEIARRVGVSRERVRQVTAEMGLDLSGLKVFVAKAQATGSETKKDACPTCDGLKSVAAITCMTCRRSTKPTHDQCECGALKLLKSARCPKCHQGYLTLRMRGPGTISSARPAVLETAMIVEGRHPAQGYVSHLSRGEDDSGGAMSGLSQGRDARAAPVRVRRREDVDRREVPVVPPARAASVNT